MPARRQACGHAVAVLALRPAVRRRRNGSSASPRPPRRAARRCSSAAWTRAGATTRWPSSPPACAPGSRSIHCQEIFDYSTYNQPYAVKVSCGFGQPMGREDPVPMLLLPSIPTMVWGGNIRLIGRGLGPGDRRDHRGGRAAAARRVGRHRDGSVREGHPGRVLAQGHRQVGGRERIVIDHITRIHPSCAPDWPQPDEGVGDHRVIVDGDPQLTIVSRADVPGGTRADGGNTTAANRLLGAINWLATRSRASTTASTCRCSPRCRPRWKRRAGPTTSKLGSRRSEFAEAARRIAVRSDFAI